MKNLNPYNGNCFDFHKKILDSKYNSKKDSTYKIRVQSLENQVEQQYLKYSAKFKTNSLETLSPHGFAGQDEVDLQALYSYRQKAIQILKIKLTTTATGRIDNTCQNCSVGQIGSFDHILPQSDFSEFVVNPINLFPSCTTCNTRKNDFLTNSIGQKLFLNLYLDTLPSVQYLFADIELENGIVMAKFYLENRNNIDENLFDLIKSHYERLNLCSLFRGNLDSVITTLKNTIESSSKRLTLKEILDSVEEQNQRTRQLFGYNYWKCILEASLIRNDIFLNTIHR